MTDSETARISALRPQLAEISQKLTAAVQPILALSAGIHEKAASVFQRHSALHGGYRTGSGDAENDGPRLIREDALDDLLAKVAGETANAASMLRHELRNPLGAIKGFGEMIEEDLEDGPILPLAQQLLTEITPSSPASKPSSRSPNKTDRRRMAPSPQPSPDPLPKPAPPPPREWSAGHQGEGKG